MTVKPVGAAITLLLALSGIGAAIPTTASPAATDASGDVTMTVAPDSIGVPEADQDLRLTVTIANHTDGEIDAGDVDISVDPARLTRPDDLTGWLASADGTVAATTQVGEVETTAIAAGETRIVTVTIAPASLGFTEEGVYALGAELVAGSITADAHTALSWKTTSTSPLNVAVVAPLIVPASTTGLIDAATLEEYTGSDGVLTDQLDQMVGRAVTIGIDPRILASIRILGTSAPQSALDFLERLRTASNPTFALSYADSDLTAALDAGSPSLLAPTSFDFAIDPALAPEGVTGTTQPRPSDTPSDDSSSEPLPTIEDLTAWDYTFPAMAWPADTSVTTTTYASLAASGYTSTLLATDNVSRTANATTSPILASIDGNRVVTADSRVSELLEAAVTAPTNAEWNSAMTELSATIALDSELATATTASLLATSARNLPESGLRLDQTLTELYSLPWATSTSLPAAIDPALNGNATAADAIIVDGVSDPSHVDTVRQLLSAEAAEVAYATIVADPLALTAERRLDLLAVLSNSWSADPDGWASSAAGFLTASDDIRGAVQIAPSSTIQLPNDRGNLPVTVSNNLDQQVTVYVTVRANSLALTVEETSVELVVEPQSSGGVRIPVQSLSNGQVLLSVSIADRLGAPVGTATHVELNVHAGWETAGTVAFGAIVVVIFGFGIFRTIRKRRRTSRISE